MDNNICGKILKLQFGQLKFLYLYATRDICIEVKKVSKTRFLKHLEISINKMLNKSHLLWKIRDSLDISMKIDEVN